SENEPVVFTQAELGWLPWIEPLPEAELNERHWAGLVDRSRAKSDYFRLLVRDPKSSKPGPRPTKTSSTTPRTACRVPSASSQRPRRLATTAASIAHPCMRALPPPIPSAAR